MGVSGEPRPATTEVRPFAAPLLALLVLLAGIEPGLADARAIEGDLLEVEGERVRLHGIDAFEPGQTCLTASGEPWRCGLAARAALATLIQGQPVSCTVLDQDDSGHYVARCTTQGGTDLARFLVSTGLAFAHGPYAGDYEDEEAAARQRRSGAWSGTFTPPWDWRGQ
jgi:endonuclease YncB( thermonuclease family)